jgi:4-hydroxy-2-oxoglutarate aldolase
MLIEGLHIPLTTPFHPDGRLALHKLASNVARYSKTPAAGLIVLGPSGEPTLLSDDETREVLRVAAQSAAPEKVLTANISRDSVHATLALAEFAAELHYDAILIAPPSLAVQAETSSQNASELLLYFQTVADRAPLSVILCWTRVSTSLSKVFPLAAAHPNVIGCLNAIHTLAPLHLTFTRKLIEQTASIKRDVPVTPTFAAVTARMKLATATTQHAATLVSAASLTGTATAIAEAPPVAQTLRTRTKTVAFQILSGNSGSLLDALNCGATGIAPAFAAGAPQATYEVYAAWKDAIVGREADQPLAREKQSRIIAAAEFTQASPAALKYACDLNGYYGGPARAPHLPLTAEQRLAIEQLMQPLHN